MQILLIALVLLLTHTLFAGQPNDLEGLPLADTEAEGSTIVGGCVNALTGTYVAPHHDLTVASAEPLSLMRGYTHDRYFKGGLHSCWRHNFDSQALIHYSKRISEEDEKQRKWEAKFLSPSGHLTVYNRNGEHKPRTINLSFSNLDINYHGLTNVGSGFVSGQTNLKNQRVEFHRKLKTVLVATGANHQYKLTQYHDANIEHPSGKFEGYIFHIHSERKPNGNQVLYFYDKHDHLQEVRSVNRAGNVLFGALHFEHASRSDLEHDPVLTVTGSNGRRTRYVFESEELKNSDIKNRFRIKTVVSPEAPTEHYRYTKNKDKTSSCLSLIIRPDNRYLKINYYGDDNEVTKNKIHSLYAPFGSDVSPKQTHRFAYQKSNTEVYDASNHKTVYRYNDEPRLTEIERYTGSGPHALYSREKFTWGSDGSGDRGNLLSHEIADSEGKIHCSRTYFYDHKGNVTREEVHGLLTGRYWSWDECYKVERYYCTNDFNLLTVERASNGMETLFFYIPNTNLPYFKLIQGSGHRIRDFYAYDDNAVLVRQIQDDGAHDDVNDLTGVTQRLITVIKPKNSGTCIGLPVEVEERYLDLATNTEILLKKTIFQYDNFGRRVQQELYDADNVLQLSTYWEYDEKGHVTKEWNSVGQVVSYKYDANGNCIYTHGPHPDVETFNKYDYSNRLISTEERHADGTSFVQSHTYNLLGEKTKSVDSFGNETLYYYNDFGKLIKIVHPECLDENGSTYIPEETIGYDFLGRENSRTDTKGYTTYQYNTLWGKPDEISYPDGTKERFAYTLDGKVTTKVEKNHTYTRFSYDQLGRKIYAETFADGKSLKKETWKYNAFHLISETDANGNVTEYKYDGAGRKSSITQIAPDGKHAITKFTYDALGRPHKTIHLLDQGASIDVSEYDVLDQIIEERTEDASGTILHKKNYTYDLQGNCIEEISYRETSAITSTIYDSRNNPIKVTDALGNTTHFTYDYGFINHEGKRVLQKTTTDPNGILTIETFDVRQKLESMEKRDPFGNLLSKERLQYDHNGQLACWLESVIVDGEVTRTIINRKIYGPNNRVEAVIEAEGTPEQKIVRYTYNNVGQQETLTKPDGIVLKSKYDASGRLMDYRSSDESIAYKYTYDNNHNLTRIIDETSDSITTRVYDHCNNITSETLGNGQTLFYSYDQLNRKTQVELPDLSSIRYRYDARYLRAVDRLDSEGNIQYTHHYTDYDLSGQASGMELPGNAGKVDLKHDLLGRRIVTNTKHWNETVPQNGYDPVGNLLRSTVRDSFGETPYHFAYDKLNQLEEEKGHVQHSYKYDSLNNCLSKDGVRRSHNALNQVLDAGEIQFSYDLNGNLIAQRQGQELWEYAYDALDRLIAVTHGNNRTRYTYDHFHRRLSKQHLKRSAQQWDIEKEELFLYVNNNEIGSFDQAGIKELRILGKGIGAEIGSAISVEKEGSILIPVHNLRGDICSLINAKTGESVQSYRYTAFGVQIVGDSVESIIPWGFSSKRHDPETGFIYFGRRYYAPALGRWITPDPIGLKDGPNLYAYVHNNPWTYSDLRGLFCMSMMPSWTFQGRSEMKSACLGMGHGAVDFGVGTLHGFHSSFSHVGAGYLELGHSEYSSMLDIMELSHARQRSFVEDKMMGMFGIDKSDSIYQSFRSGTTLGLEVASLASTGYGLVRGGMALFRASRMSEMASTLTVPHVPKLTFPKASGNLAIPKSESSSNGFLGHKGYELLNPFYQKTRNAPTTIQGRLYSGHALDQMQNRGFMPSIVENTIKRASRVTSKHKPDEFEYYDLVNKTEVVLNELGDVVTVKYKSRN